MTYRSQIEDRLGEIPMIQGDGFEMVPHPAYVDQYNELRRQLEQDRAGYFGKLPQLQAGLKFAPNSAYDLNRDARALSSWETIRPDGSKAWAIPARYDKSRNAWSTMNVLDSAGGYLPGEKGLTGYERLPEGFRWSDLPMSGQAGEGTWARQAPDPNEMGLAMYSQNPSVQFLAKRQPEKEPGFFSDLFSAVGDMSGLKVLGAGAGISSAVNALLASGALAGAPAAAAAADPSLLTQYGVTGNAAELAASGANPALGTASGVIPGTAGATAAAGGAGLGFGGDSIAEQIRFGTSADAGARGLGLTDVARAASTSSNFKKLKNAASVASAAGVLLAATGAGATGAGATGMDTASVLRAADDARAARTAENRGRVGAAFGRFDNAYYGNIADAYKQFQTPRVNETFDEATRQLIYRAPGGVGSGTFARKLGEAERDRGRALSAVGDEAAVEAQNQRAGVEGQRAALLSMADSAEDPGAFGEQAVAAAESASRAPSYSPLADLFARYSSLAAASALEDRRNALGTGVRTNQAFPSLTFPFSGSSSRTVR